MGSHYSKKLKILTSQQMGIIPLKAVDFVIFNSCGQLLHWQGSREIKKLSKNVSQHHKDYFLVYLFYDRKLNVVEYVSLFFASVYIIIQTNQ